MYKKTVVFKERVTILLNCLYYIKECKQQVTNRNKENRMLQNTGVKLWFSAFQTHCPLE